MNLLTEARPLTDVATERLEAEISSVAATIAAVTCRWLAMIAEYDRRKAWEGWECRSMTHWLVGHVGLASSTAREHVRVARALAILPLLAAEFGGGRLSYSRVRTVTRVATPANEAKLVDFARACTAPQLERWVTAIERAKMADDPDAAQRIFDVRSVTFAYEDHGVWVARLRLPPEVGAMLANLIAVEVDAARLDESDVGSGDERLSIEQRRADAFAVIVERAAACTCTDDGDNTIDDAILDANDNDRVDSDRVESASGTLCDVGFGDPYNDDIGGDVDAHSGDPIDEALKTAMDTSRDVESVAGGEFDLDNEEPDLEVLDLDVLDSLDSEWAFGSGPKADKVDAKRTDEPRLNPSVSRTVTKPSVRVGSKASVANGCRQANNETVGIRSGRFTPKTRSGDGVICRRRDPLVVVHRYPDGAELNRRPLPVTTADRLACECLTVSLDHDIEGNPLNFGRTRRSPNAAQRRAAAERDQSCRFPGCGSRKGLRLHHVKYWGRDKGRTDLENLVYLCGKHHRAVHDLHWRIVGTPDGQIDFIRPDRDGPMRPRPPIDLDELVAGFLDPLGPIRSTAGAGDKLDLEMAVWGYFANEHLVQQRLIQQRQAEESASSEALTSQS